MGRCLCRDRRPGEGRTDRHRQHSPGRSGAARHHAGTAAGQCQKLNVGAVQHSAKSRPKNSKHAYDIVSNHDREMYSFVYL